jgi:hypothetical protein
MASRIVHGLTPECHPVRHGMLAAPRQRPAVALANVQCVIDMAAETRRTVKPGTRTDKHTA